MPVLVDAHLARSLVDAVERRTNEIVAALDRLDEAGVRAPSALPGWSRLTIACHLRFGAEALARMTSATLHARPEPYYPGGREQKRPATLHPLPGEAPVDVNRSLAAHGRELGRCWSGLGDGEWRLAVREPAGNRDLGPLQLAQLPLLRLTEVEVHGSDLALGLADWSDLFVRTALPFRLDWLNVRRSNHRTVDTRPQGSWLLVAHEGPTYLVSADGDVASARPAGDDQVARATIEGSSRDILALLLGRPLRQPLRYRGDETFAAAFAAAFPGP